MFLGERLFALQLRELLDAGYTSGSLHTCAGPKSDKRIVITFDDGYVNVLRHGLAPLAANGFTAVQFLVADLIGKHNAWDVALGEAPDSPRELARADEGPAGGHD